MPLCILVMTGCQDPRSDLSDATFAIGSSYLSHPYDPAHPFQGRDDGTSGGSSGGPSSGHASGGNSALALVAVLLLPMFFATDERTGGEPFSSLPAKGIGYQVRMDIDGTGSTTCVFAIVDGHAEIPARVAEHLRTGIWKSLILVTSGRLNSTCHISVDYRNGTYVLSPIYVFRGVPVSQSVIARIMHTMNDVHPGMTEDQVLDWFDLESRVDSLLLTRTGTLHDQVVVIALDPDHALLLHETGVHRLITQAPDFVDFTPSAAVPAIRCR